MDRKQVNEFWETMKNCTPQKRKEIMDNLKPEELNALRAASNPYRKPLYPVGDKFLEFSYINMPREYTSRLMMTSLVGFIYKMAFEAANGDSINLDESKYVSENEGEFALKLNELYREYNLRKLEMHYRQFRDDPDLMHHARWLRARAIVAQRLMEIPKDKLSMAHLTPDIPKDTVDLEEEAKSYCKEHGLRFEACFPADVTPSQEELDVLKAQLKKDMGIKKTLQEKIQQRQDQILDFLDYHFKYDPNNHIRCNYAPNYDDKIKERRQEAPGSFAYEEFPKPQIANHDGNCGPTGNHDEPKQHMIITEGFEKYLVPPMDTFYAFNAYFDSNYEHLRQCTDDIYGELSEFETAILAREVFTSTDKAEQWKKKYAEDFDISVMRAKFGAWTFVDPWQANRKVIKTGDDKSKLIDHILETKKEEERMGKKLLKKRGRKMRGNVIGKDVPFENKLSDMGAERFTDEDKIEAKVISTKLVRSRRPRFGNINTVSYTIEPEAPTKD